MDSFFLNKVVGWVLFTALMVFGLQTLADIVYHADQPAQKGMTVEVAAVDTDTPDEAEKPKDPPIATLMASATADDGAKLFGKCKACHDPAKGGKSKVGPPLYDIMGRQVAGLDGFKYSASLSGKAGETWSYENLNVFLKNPKDYAAKTKMVFKGFKKAEERAAMIAYLRSLSDNPQPLPVAEAPKAEEEAPKAEDDAAQPKAEDAAAEPKTEDEAQPKAEGDAPKAEGDAPKADDGAAKPEAQPAQ